MSLWKVRLVRRIDIDPLPATQVEQNHPGGIEMIRNTSPGRRQDQVPDRLDRLQSSPERGNV